jgi:hypothetical protein
MSGWHVTSRKPALHLHLRRANLHVRVLSPSHRFHAQVHRQGTRFQSGLDMFGARCYASSLGWFMTPGWVAKPTNVRTRLSATRRASTPWFRSSRLRACLTPIAAALGGRRHAQTESKTKLSLPSLQSENLVIQAFRSAERITEVLAANAGRNDLYRSTGTMVPYGCN